MIERRPSQQFDWIFFSLILLLTVFGLANLYSATYVAGENGLPPAFQRQLFSLGVAIVAGVSAAVIDYRKLERFSGFLFVGTLLLLASTLVFSPLVQGNRSWLLYGPFSVQPAELAKLGLIIAIARHLHHHPPLQKGGFRDLLFPALITLCPVVLIVLQRDLGVAVLTGLIAFTYVPFLRITGKVWIALGVSGVFVLVGVWQFFLKTYQRDRILDFFDPTRDPLASGYQALQSKIAVGSGGIFGRGFLDGTQTHLQFLPTKHSDFIFSVLGEEWGFLGTSTVIILYAGLLLWGLSIAQNAKDTFGAMIAVGLVGMFFWPAVINIGMVLGLVPVIGVPLPLFSYGGSSLVAAYIGLGLLLNISMRRYIF